MKQALEDLGNMAKAVAKGEEAKPNRAERRAKAHQARKDKSRAARRKHEKRFPRG